MTVTVNSFRDSYTEFQNPEMFPNSDIQFYLNYAALLLNQCRFGNLLDIGTGLFIAHNLTLEARAKAEAEAGGVPGVGTGPVQLKVASKVQIQYGTQFAVELDAGHWNNTIYGTRFIRLARMVGSGPVQVGLPGPGEWGFGTFVDPGTTDGWSGPDCTPGFANFS
jgi:hypothetical protein